MVAGAPKSGSTALYHYLSEHPEVASHDQREMTFFARSNEFDQGWEFALDRYFPDIPSGQPLIAKHTMAMYDLPGVRRISEDSAVVVAVVLRNPVDRAYSHYQYARLRGWESADTFEAALALEESRPAGDPPRARDMRYTAVGTYEPVVRNLIDTFGRERLRIYLSSDIRTSAADVCAELFELAGLDPSFVPDTQQRHNEGHQPRSALMSRLFLSVQEEGSPIRKVASKLFSNRTLSNARYRVQRLNEGSGKPPPMADHTRHLLEQKFVEPNNRLAELLDRDLSAWAPK